MVYELSLVAGKILTPSILISVYEATRMGRHKTFFQCSPSIWVNGWQERAKKRFNRTKSHQSRCRPVQKARGFDGNINHRRPARSIVNHSSHKSFSRSYKHYAPWLSIIDHHESSFASLLSIISQLIIHHEPSATFIKHHQHSLTKQNIGIDNHHWPPDGATQSLTISLPKKHTWIVVVIYCHPNKQQKHMS